MLISPLKLHHDLGAVVDTAVHTALFILPHGRLLSSATRYDETYDEDSDDPYLDEPERLRLLCGLASQWEQDGSEKVECEPDTTTMSMNLPTVKPLETDVFVLALNGSAGTAWSVLVGKADEFKKRWSR